LNCASHDDPGAALRYAILEWDGRELQASIHVHDDRGELGEVRGMERRHAEALRRAGVTTVGQLHDMGIEALQTVVKGYAPRYWVMAKARIERRPVFRAPPPLVAPDALYLDVETSFDPADVWMVGFGTADGEIEQLHALGRRKQRKLLEDLDGRMRQIRPSQFLQWSAYDRNALEKAYLLHWSKAPSWLDRAMWIDAMWWADRAYALPFRSRSIKDVSAYFGYAYAEGKLDGMTVGAWYSMYLRSKEPFDVPRVRIYNRDDVQALRRVVGAIRKLVLAESPHFSGSQDLANISRPASAFEREAPLETATANNKASPKKRGRGRMVMTRIVSVSAARHRARASRRHELPDRSK
jgi:hypothetical protein